MSKLIILDSGHAKSTGGKRSPDSSLLEWDFNNEMQYKLKKRLEEHGFTVYLTNPNPGTVKDIALTTRANLANTKWKTMGKPDALFVSVHANAAGSCSSWLNARGVEVYHANNASQKSKDAALKVCNVIYNGVHDNIDKGFRNRGRKAANFTVIYKTAMPSILIEYAFYDNKQDIEILKNKKDQLTEYTVQGLCQYFGVTYIKPAVQTKPVEKTDPNTFYRVITGSYLDRKNAEEERDRIKKLGYDAFLVAAVINGKTYLRVVAASENSKNAAERIILDLKNKGVSAFISVYNK